MTALEGSSRFGRRLVWIQRALRVMIHDEIPTSHIGTLKFHKHPLLCKFTSTLLVVLCTFSCYWPCHAELTLQYVPLNPVTLIH